MLNKDFQIILYITWALTVAIIPVLFIFFNTTGEKFLIVDKNFKEGVCIPMENMWKVEDCTLKMIGVIMKKESKKCYFDVDCNIFFNEPKKYPLWFWVIIIIELFILILTGPIPANMDNWRRKVE